MSLTSASFSFSRQYTHLCRRLRPSIFCVTDALVCITGFAVAPPHARLCHRLQRSFISCRCRDRVPHWIRQISLLRCVLVSKPRGKFTCITITHTCVAVYNKILSRVVIVLTRVSLSRLLCHQLHFVHVFVCKSVLVLLPLAGTLRCMPISPDLLWRLRRDHHFARSLASSCSSWVDPTFWCK